MKPTNPETAIRIFPEEDGGALRRINGVNGAPVNRNWYQDQRHWFRHWQIPNVRTHDLPYNAFDTVDLHHIFPNPDADPNDPASYRFALTDDLLQAIRDTGAEIYYRLGESIEHQPTKMWSCPERWTPERMAKVCLHIVQHYNEGWAGGFKWGIRYWEFWCEPNGPKTWNGTPGQFFELYRAVAVALKKHDPELKVGLAGFTSSVIELDLKESRPWKEGLRKCAADGIPIDFLSWHKYHDTWDGLRDTADAVRVFLRSAGLPDAESHLGEWGYRPFMDTEEGGICIFQTRNMKRYDLMAELLKRQGSHEGAALIFGMLATLQDADVDLAQYYTATVTPFWGLFSDAGLPNTRSVGFEVFAEFLRGSARERRIRTETDGAHLAALASRTNDGAAVRVGIANLGNRTVIPVQMPSPGWRATRLRVLDAVHPWREVQVPEFDAASVRIPVAGPALAVLELEKGERIGGEPMEESVVARQDVAGDW